MHTYMAFVETFNKEKGKQLLKMHKSFRTLKKYQQFGIKIWISL